jgi:hypothetical protein
LANGDRIKINIKIVWFKRSFIEFHQCEYLDRLSEPKGFPQGFPAITCDTQPNHKHVPYDSELIESHPQQQQQQPKRKRKMQQWVTSPGPLSGGFLYLSRNFLSLSAFVSLHVWILAIMSEFVTIMSEVKFILVFVRLGESCVAWGDFLIFFAFAF